MEEAEDLTLSSRSYNVTRGRKTKAASKQQEENKAVGDRDVTLGGEERESSTIGPDVNRVQNGGGCASEAESQELPGEGAAWGGRAVRRAREHRARLCPDRLGWPSAGARVRAPRP